MLRLPIFQKNKHQEFQPESLSPATALSNAHPSNTASQISQSNRSMNLNKKKAQFEKKIKKFIESDSPHRLCHQKRATTDYSFETDTLQTQYQGQEEIDKNGKTIFNDINMENHEESSLWDHHKDDSN